MNKIILSITTFLFVFISMGFISPNNNKLVEKPITENIMTSNYSEFCDGWDEGYQEALKGCYKVAVTPVCPVAPVGKNTYKHGYGLGYAKATAKHCED
ncbi:hypothetical protein OAQ16_05545 [Flavobacteriales bacterium]|nr:hypothetical protein [Flavobacteriales bacterium]